MYLSLTQINFSDLRHVDSTDQKIKTMKKQVLLIAAIFSAILFSCTKAKIETSQSNQLTQQPESAQSQKMGIPSLSKNLECLYEFNSNLKETTGQLADAIASTSGAENYTDDRFGQPEKAIKFNGRYGLTVPDVPTPGSNFSIAAWVKYDSTNLSTNYFVHCNAACPQFAQSLTNFWGVVSTPSTNGLPSPPQNNGWHHLVATYNGTDLKFYVDGSFVGTIQNPFLGGPYPVGSVLDYQLGYMTPMGSKDIISAWYGSMDDFRFYTRTLGAKEVLALYNL
jgi:hypothetical protein